MQCCDPPFIPRALQKRTECMKTMENINKFPSGFQQIFNNMLENSFSPSSFLSYITIASGSVSFTNHRKQPKSFPRLCSSPSPFSFHFLAYCWKNLGRGKGSSGPQFIWEDRQEKCLRKSELLFSTCSSTRSYKFSKPLGIVSTLASSISQSECLLFILVIFICILIFISYLHYKNNFPQVYHSHLRIAYAFPSLVFLLGS